MSVTTDSDAELMASTGRQKTTGQVFIQFQKKKKMAVIFVTAWLEISISLVYR